MRFFIINRYAVFNDPDAQLGHHDLQIMRLYLAVVHIHNAVRMPCIKADIHIHAVLPEGEGRLVAVAVFLPVGERKIDRHTKACDTLHAA